MKKLAIISTHPIQYYAPIFQLLHRRGRIEIKVFYTWGEGSYKKHDPGFGKTIVWDLPLLENYNYEWVLNTATEPGSHHFSGIKNPGLIQQITAWQPDAVLVFGWAYISHLKIIRHFYNKLPVYFRGDSTLLDRTPSIRSLFKPWFLKWVYKHVDLAFYVGSANKEYFKRYGLKEDQLVFAPHAIDNDRFAEDRSSEASSLRNQLGIAEDEILVLFAGKLGKKKDPQILLQAFLELNKPNVHLLFAGNGEMEEELKSASTLPIEDRDRLLSMTENPVKERIHFMDFQNQTQMPVLYQACDLFCLPSVGPETWGLAISEAMACGKAILASDRAGCKADLVKPGINGSIFKCGNLEDLKQKLDDLTVSKELLAAFGAKSKEMISGWNFLNIAEALEQQVNNGS